MNSDIELPLAGLRFIVLASVPFGPYTTQQLGDLGADVSKEEASETDVTSRISPRRHRHMTAGFLAVNRERRSVQLDRKRAPARSALWRLVAGADVFVHNILPQKIQALGFGVDAVMAAKPDIVLDALHGYLEEEPYAGRLAYDDVIQTECGIAHTFTLRDGTPTLAPTVIAGNSAG